MSIARWMLLGLEERVEVPEAGFHEAVGRHLREAHFDEDGAEFLANLQQRMQVTAVRHLTAGGEVVGLEVDVFPRATVGKAKEQCNIMQIADMQN